MDLQLLLERHGWCVLGTAATAKEALEFLAREVPAVAILDVTLRDGSVQDRGESPREGLAPGHSKVAAPAVLSFSNCEIATINCDMPKGFSIMILLGTP
ncbi:hypothetical protein [Sinorhizobium meliloti]|uniref:hypothetical protein n=1 Tax=Rhizobium meliloti TaxID=382 RepID=UPI003F5CEBFF